MKEDYEKQRKADEAEAKTVQERERLAKETEASERLGARARARETIRGNLIFKVYVL